MLTELTVLRGKIKNCWLWWGVLNVEPHGIGSSDVLVVTNSHHFIRFELSIRFHFIPSRMLNNCGGNLWFLPDLARVSSKL